MSNEHRFAGWDPFDDSHIKNIKDVQDDNIDIEQVFEPDDCDMVICCDCGETIEECINPNSD
tara:strand:- start:290 stop:475 length:186 start_codon:yes stop_codon:yes gene_type:complete